MHQALDPGSGASKVGHIGWVCNEPGSRDSCVFKGDQMRLQMLQEKRQ